MPRSTSTGAKTLALGSSIMQSEWFIVVNGYRRYDNEFLCTEPLLGL